MRRAIIPFFLLAFILSQTGCQKQSGNQPAAQPRTAVTTPAPWKLTLTTIPDPPVSGKETTFRVKLADQAGKPVSGAQVKAALVMTIMEMGKNEVSFADKNNGDYEGTGKFTMSGPWNVVVSAAAQDKTGKQTFPVVVHRE